MSAEPFLSSSWYRVGKLRPRLRQHVAVRRHRYRGNVWYVLHDEATGHVHRLAPASYVMVNAMDGSRSVDQALAGGRRQAGAGGAEPGRDDPIPGAAPCRRPAADRERARFRRAPAARREAAAVVVAAECPQSPGAAGQALAPRRILRAHAAVGELAGRLAGRRPLDDGRAAGHGAGHPALAGAQRQGQRPHPGRRQHGDDRA